ncbi:MAG: inorganic phosphate transporter [Ruminococcaceae bacterium]|nr:inorganic phosphate transporter [Oscillospiraceae bacterium]
MNNILPAILTTGVIIENGGTDAPNSVSACVASGVLSPRRASLFAALCNFAGAVVSGLFFPAVARTLSELSGLPAGEENLPALTGAMLAVLLWTGAAWLFSVPTSESHGLMAALGGAAMYFGHGGGFGRWAAMIATAGISVGAGWLGGRLAERLFRRKTLSEKALGRAQLAFAGASAVLHGAQDGQKFMCIFALCSGGRLSWQAVLWCGGVLALGTALCGKRMLSLAGSLGVSSRAEGLAADAGGTAVLLGATVLGIPVSTTHVKTAAQAGAGQGGRKNALFSLVLAWILTFPVCALLGYFLVPVAEFMLNIA